MSAPSMRRRMHGVGVRVLEHLLHAQAAHVGAPVGQVQLAQLAAQLGVLDRDHPPALAVAAAGGEAGGVECPREHLGWHRLAVEAPRRGGAAHRLVQVHGAGGRYPYSTARSTFAGAPAATEKAGMSRVTTRVGPDHAALADA